MYVAVVVQGWGTSCLSPGYHLSPGYLSPGYRRAMLLHPRHSGRKHRHANADEVLYLIRGQVRVHAGDETQELQPGDSLSIPAGLVHQIGNMDSDDAEMTISYSTGEREYAAK
jgi:quercetin dioxygenase-like cupin family protein